MHHHNCFNPSLVKGMYEKTGAILVFKLAGVDMVNKT